MQTFVQHGITGWLFANSDAGLTVAFASETPNLVPGDEDLNDDIFMLRR